ncbi:ScbA/BarX family gamma-butyrolactone biosynthesis protein [Streptomyces sp. Sge12]|uniref:ScbA/BarX family gamma-butyrolactone biosynthesis protein n=1 Tax=Streptomyces sp. Sge12 TaxID=1972846 RepID=UPI001F351570|nr:ScbA/BarX family gamma-butyrolactone biosynthesis protein [Streptomyces sp. Sge12]
MTMLTIGKHAPVLPLPGTEQPWMRCNDARQLTTTVPREYVHRSSLAEVFLTGCERTGQDTFTLTGQWPRAHTFFTSADGTGHDPVQAGETVRQVGLYLCHAVYGVPLGHNVLLWSLDFTTRPEHLRIGRGPSDLTMNALCTDFGWKGNRFSGYLSVDIHRNGELAARGTARFSCVAPATYRRLRGDRGRLALTRPLPRRTPVPAHTTGRLLPFDVVLAPTDHPGRWQLNPDLDHPILFEHANDHHPGMVLVEAARQAASALHAPATFTPAAIATEFHHYAELDAPCWIDATLTAPGHVAITGHQENRTIFRSTVTATTT